VDLAYWWPLEGGGGAFESEYESIREERAVSLKGKGGGGEATDYFQGFLLRSGDSEGREPGSTKDRGTSCGRKCQHLIDGASEGQRALKDISGGRLELPWGDVRENPCEEETRGKGNALVPLFP